MQAVPMPLYTFHVHRPNGAPLSLEAIDLEDDDRVVTLAFDLLNQHPNAAEVIVWCGERRVMSRNRVDESLRSLLSQAAGWSQTRPS
jgi:hypothetical protein